MSTATFDTLATLLVADYRLNERRSLSSTENSIAKLRAFFGSGCPVASITYDRLMAFTVSRLEAGRARATVRKELAALKRAFHLIRRSDPAIPLPAFPQVHVSNARRGFLTRAQFNALVDALPPYASAAVRFMYVSGWRRSEVLALRWEQVDWDAGVIRLDSGTTKNGDGRVFPFGVHPDLRPLLESQAHLTDELQRRRRQIIPWIFHKNGKRLRNFRKVWSRAREAAELPDLIPHDLRRTAARNFDRAGVRRSTAMKLMGHKTESIFLRYSVGDHADLEEGVARVGALNADDDSKSTTRHAGPPRTLGAGDEGRA